jgi:hypothetical protein
MKKLLIQPEGCEGKARETILRKVSKFEEAPTPPRIREEAKSTEDMEIFRSEEGAEEEALSC